MSFTVPQISADVSHPFAATPYRAKSRPMAAVPADSRQSEQPTVKVPVDSMRGKNLDLQA